MKKSMNMGGSIVSKIILENKGRIKWCFREESMNYVDNGWRYSVMLAGLKQVAVSFDVY